MPQYNIRFEHVAKKYNIRERGYRSLREDIFRFFNQFTSQLTNNQSDSMNKGEFYALKDVSFEIAQGEVIGIIGPNGAGKTTILKLLAKVTLPTEGKVYTNGRIAAMIELGAGFHPELTGRENIYLNGSIMGMKKAEINKKFDEIVEFSELEKFIDTPLKRYSTGMKARLGFSVVAHIDPAILLIDEVLSVGDIPFQEKCINKMEEFRNRRTSIIFVSHNLESVTRLCKRTILLDDGKIIMDCNTNEAIANYFKVISQRQIHGSSSCKDSGVKQAEIINAELLDFKDRKPCLNFTPRDVAIFRYTVIFNESIDHPSFGFFVRRTDRLLILDTSTYKLNIKIKSCKRGTKLTVDFRFAVNLLKGVYYIGSFIGDCLSNKDYDYIDNAVTFTVDEESCWGGVADLKPECTIIEETG